MTLLKANLSREKLTSSLERLDDHLHQMLTSLQHERPQRARILIDLANVVASLRSVGGLFGLSPSQVEAALGLTERHRSDCSKNRARSEHLARLMLGYYDEMGANLWLADAEPHTSLSEFDLTVRTANCLAAVGIVTTGDLASWTANELLRSIPNFGQRCLDDLREKLAIRYETTFV